MIAFRIPDLEDGIADRWGPSPDTRKPEEGVLHLVRHVQGRQFRKRGHRTVHGHASGGQERFPAPSGDRGVGRVPKGKFLFGHQVIEDPDLVVIRQENPVGVVVDIQACHASQVDELFRQQVTGFSQQQRVQPHIPGVVRLDGEQPLRPLRNVGDEHHIAGPAGGHVHGGGGKPSGGRRCNGGHQGIDPVRQLKTDDRQIKGPLHKVHEVLEVRL